MRNEMAFTNGREFHCDCDRGVGHKGVPANSESSAERAAKQAQATKSGTAGQMGSVDVDVGCVVCSCASPIILIVFLPPQTIESVMSV